MSESGDLRQFIRDIANRHERIWREEAQMLWRVLDEIHVITAELRDTRDERRAHTEALLRVIDRLDGGGAKA